MTETGASLRERRRADLTAQVKAVARRQLVEEGVAALSLRAVAREVGIAVSALYRYFAGRDELLTELLVDAFDAQADRVQAAVDDALRAAPDDPGAALRAGFTAYRDWSREHPAEFGLCYGAPVPGYAAPADRTVRAATRVPDLLLDLVARAADPAAEAVRERGARLGEDVAAQLAVLRDRRGYRLSLPLLAAATDGLVRLHGFVAMEVFGQLRPIVPDAGGLFAETLEDALRRMGV